MSVSEDSICMPLDESAIPTLVTKTNCLIVQWPQPEFTTDLQIGLCFPLDKCFVLLMTLKPDGWKYWKYLSAVASKGWCEWFIINRVSDVMRSDVNWRICCAKMALLYIETYKILHCNVDWRLAFHLLPIQISVWSLFLKASNHFTLLKNSTPTEYVRTRSIRNTVGEKSPNNLLLPARFWSVHSMDIPWGYGRACISGGEASQLIMATWQM